MKKIKIIFTFLVCLVIKNALAINENDANQFVVDIGNQAIKILKIPVDDKEKRKKELQNLLQEKFDMPFIARIILGKEVFKNTSEEKFKKFSDIFEVHIVKIYSSQLGTYKGQKFTVKNTEIKKKEYNRVTNNSFLKENILILCSFKNSFCNLKECKSVPLIDWRKKA